MAGVKPSHPSLCASAITCVGKDVVTLGKLLYGGTPQLSPKLAAQIR